MNVSLTAKQRAFVAEYLVDLNATQAAVRAGYSARTAVSIGYENLRKPQIVSVIQAAQQARSQRTEITADRVLLELGRIAFFDIRKLYDANGNLRRPHELDDDAAAVLAGIDMSTAKVFDKNAALTLAMRHLGMLQDRLAISRPTVHIRDFTGKGDPHSPLAESVLALAGTADRVTGNGASATTGGATPNDESLSAAASAPLARGPPRS
jgi:phage terminase small subunit